MPRQQRTRAGSRIARFRPGGRMSENRFAWLRTVIGQFVIMRYESDKLNEDPEDEDDNEYGPTVRLILPRQSGAPIKYNLTALTEEELRMTREFFNLLFDLAEPVVRERDRIAHEAFAAGDDSFARIYRQVPQFIVRGRPGSTDNQGVHDGPEGFSDGAGRVGDPSGRDGVDGGELADGDTEAGRSKDNDPTSD